LTSRQRTPRAGAQFTRILRHLDQYHRPLEFIANPSPGMAALHVNVDFYAFYLSAGGRIVADIILSPDRILVPSEADTRRQPAIALETAGRPRFRSIPGDSEVRIRKVTDGRQISVGHAVIVLATYVEIHRWVRHGLSRTQRLRINPGAEKDT